MGEGGRCTCLEALSLGFSQDMVQTSLVGHILLLACRGSFHILTLTQQQTGKGMLLPTNIACALSMLMETIPSSIAWGNMTTLCQ